MEGSADRAPDAVDTAELCESAEALARVDPRLARVVECRYFAGYTDEETGRILGVTTRTVRRDWVKARAWLRNALDAEAPRSIRDQHTPDAGSLQD